MKACVAAGDTECAPPRLRRVMLESFISTQKLSVQKMLARKFARFMSYKRDFLELLMSTLQSLVREQLQIESITGAVGGNEVLVPMRCATGSGFKD